MPLKQIPIAELTIGMYVAKLDLSWFRSPFMRHSFLVKNHSQIERLINAGVRKVIIDPAQSLAATGIFETPDSCMTESEEKISESPWSQPMVKSLAQIQEEYVQAKLVQQKLDQAVHAVFSVITKTGTVHPEQAAEAV